MEEELMAERHRNGFNWENLHAGDLVKIAYQHRSPGRHELTLGDTQQKLY